MLSAGEQAPPNRVPQALRPLTFRGDQPIEFGVHEGGYLGEEIPEFVHPLQIIFDTKGLINFADRFETVCAVR
jgi:hypothetical protein